MPKATPINKYKRFNEKNHRIYFISMDWLQIHVVHGQDFGEKNTLHYRIIRTGQTKTFRNVYAIKNIWGQLVATYATDPTECILKPFHGILKLENSQLYRRLNVASFTECLLDELHMRFVGITRLDISYDFNSFQNELEPERFIQKFVSGKILKLMKSKFRLSGTHDKKNVFEWLFFGSKTSDVHYKLYNKTVEQKNEGRKPYIWDSWEKSSLLDTKKDVWRLEFTVNSTTAIFCNRFTFSKFHNLDMLRVENYASLFVGLFQHFFRFVTADFSKNRKARMKEVLLLDFDESILAFERVKINSEKKDSTRSTKIAIAFMERFNNEMRQFDDNIQDETKSVISKLIEQHGLQEWAKGKYIEFTETNYPENIEEFKKLADD